MSFEESTTASQTESPRTPEPEEPSAKRQKLEDPAEAWIPPSVSSLPGPSFHASTTYHSQIPQLILENKTASVVLGVDEAGRGPVLGPMVYGISYCLESYQQHLKRYGFADSKTLKEDKRRELFYMIESADHELHNNVGWATRTMTARDISSAMLQGRGAAGGANLNEQAHNTTIQLIREVLHSGVNVEKVFVDTVGPPATYQKKLQAIFPTLEVTVTKKADSIFPIVSTASVVAKVTRDLNIHYYHHRLELLQGHTIGSGYPSDPNTSAWLHGNVDPVFGWCPLVRFSWQTAKDSLKNHHGVSVVYEADCEKDPGYGDVSNLLEKASNYCVEVDFYGSNVVL